MTTNKKFNTFYFNSKIVCLSLIIFLLVLFFAFTYNHETRSDFQSQTHSSSHCGYKNVNTIICHKAVS